MISKRKKTMETQNIAELITRLSDKKDPILIHGNRVAKLAGAIAQAMGYSEKEIDLVCQAAVVHDAGKFELPAEVINKPGPLDEPERLLIKMHPDLGYRLLQKLEFDPVVAQVALQHHERLNGSGYPLGLRDKDIFPITKIISVADVIETMVSAQVYRPAVPVAKALNEIKQNSGLLYDPEVVAAALSVIEGEKRL